MWLTEQRERLNGLNRRIQGDNFQIEALRDSTGELSYILQRTEELWPGSEIDLTSTNQLGHAMYITSTRGLRFYSQCLLLWSCRILEILDEIAGIKAPPAIGLARIVVAAHYGTANGKLKHSLKRETGFLVSPGFVPGGIFKYAVGPLGSPASTASPSERHAIETLFRKYCPEDKEFNWWTACYKILHQPDREVSGEDSKQILRFLRDNGGILTDSKSVIECVISSLQMYLGDQPI